MARKKITVKQALDNLHEKYARTLSMLDDALDMIDDLEEELKIKPKEVEVEKVIEKVVEVEVPVEVEKETVVTVQKEVPGPERIVEVPGPERIVEKINPAESGPLTPTFACSDNSGPVRLHGVTSLPAETIPT